MGSSGAWFARLFIENLPGLVVVEAEFLNGVVLVLQGHMPLADDLRGVAVLLELARETWLGRMEIDILLTLAVEDDFQPVLKWIPPGQQRAARGRTEGIAERTGEAHAILREPVDVWRLVRGAAVGGKALHAEVVGEDEEDVGFACGCRRWCIGGM